MADPAHGPPGPPNTAVIPLPPGMTLPQFFDLQGKIVTIAIAVAVAAGIVVWDFLALVPEELALYRSSEKSLWKTPGAWAFIILRYAGPIALVPGIWFTSLQNDHCQLAASLSQGGVVLVTGAAGVIFCYRVFSIWRNNKLIMGLVGFLWAIMVGCWIAVATSLRAQEGPPTPFGSNCLLGSVPPWSPIGFASSVAFDTVVLALTLFKLNGITKKSGVGRQIVGDNVMFFVFVTATNIAALAVQSLPSSYNLIKPAVLPFPTLITSAMGTRVYLNLRLFNQRQVNGTLPSSMPSHGHISSHAHGTNVRSHAVPLTDFKDGVSVVQSTYTRADGYDQKRSHLNI